ncbi:MAG: T9SS type A sorting domain-containing protein [bacterium]
MKMKLLLFLLLLLVPSVRLLMQEIPDCMCPPMHILETGHQVNIDSAIVIDTCGIWYPSASCDSAYWNNIRSEYQFEAQKRLYSRAYWEILFLVDVIPIPASHPDSVIIVDWTSIDTTFTELREAFEQLEEKFDDFYLKKLYPSSGDGKSSRRFRLYFTNYVNLKQIEKHFEYIPDILISFGRDIPVPNIIDYDVITNINYCTISPNPASEYIEITVGENSRRQTGDGRQEWDIQIYNVYGEQMTNLTPTPYTPLIPLERGMERGARIDISSFPDGVYFLKLSESSELSESYQVRKFVLIK